MIATRTHVVATAAYECVSAHKDDTRKKEYRALAHSLPGMILQNGLAQATGFLLAKGKDEHRALLDDLNDVLRLAKASGAEDGPALHRLVIDADLARTMRLTRQSLQASGWIKRYAQGLLGEREQSDQDEGNGEG